LLLDEKCYRREREEKREIYAGEMVQERGGKNQKKKIGMRRTYGTEEVIMVAGGRWNLGRKCSVMMAWSSVLIGDGNIWTRTVVVRSPTIRSGGDTHHPLDADLLT
jgi:hypothetical protein